MMKWTYAIKNKLTAAGILMAVFFIVLISNFMDKRNASKVNEAVLTIYEDRVIAQAYIFEYTKIIDGIDEIFHNDELSNAECKEQIIGALSEIESVNVSFLKTYLTPQEEETFMELTSGFDEIGVHVRNNNFELAHQQTKNSMSLLEGLTGIQVMEATNQMSIINEITAISDLNAYFEIAALVILGLMMQVLIFSSRSLNHITNPKYAQLN